MTFPFNVTEFTGNLKPMCEWCFTGKVNSAIYWYYGVKGAIESSHINSCLPFQIPCFVKLFSRWEFFVVLMNFGSSSWFLGSCCFLLLSCGRIQSCVEKVSADFPCFFSVFFQISSPFTVKMFFFRFILFNQKFRSSCARTHTHTLIFLLLWCLFILIKI